MNLNEVYTLKEASQIWNISDSNLRNALVKFNRFEQQIKKGTVKKSCGTWLVTRQAMIQVFGEPKKEGKLMKEFNELLEGFSVDFEKAKVEENEHSIDIMLMDDEGYNGYGNKFYSVHEAFDFLKKNDCLE